MFRKGCRRGHCLIGSIRSYTDNAPPRRSSPFLCSSVYCRNWRCFFAAVQSSSATLWVQGAALFQLLVRGNGIHRAYGRCDSPRRLARRGGR